MKNCSFCENAIKKNRRGVSGGGGSGGGFGGQGGCERRTEVIAKMQKNRGWGSGPVGDGGGSRGRVVKGEGVGWWQGSG